MTALVYLVACMLIGHVAGSVVELSCSDNATCIENMMKDFARSIRQKKTVRLYDTFEIEPLESTRQMRSSQGALSKFLETHAFSYDWNDYTFRLAKSQDRPDTLDLEVYESRTAKDVSEPVPKKSKSKVEHGEDQDDKKSPKRRRPINRHGSSPRQLIDITISAAGIKHKLVTNDIDKIVNKIVTPPKKNKVTVPSKLAATHVTGNVNGGVSKPRSNLNDIQQWRRQKKKVLQAVIPLLFGMKSTGAVIFVMAVVTALVMKAFIASKLALMVTVGMALKRLYESYSNGVGLQNHPYLYSQYPIDFPSASSHAYSVSGVNPQFGTPEMYNPTGLASQMIQTNDASAQQSQQAPTVQLANATRAAERWDGKSLIQRFLGPIVDGIKTIVNPIANVVYDAMPATFRGLNTEVSTAKTYETEPLIAEETVKQPREILVPQPRNIAQRKMNYRSAMIFKPKKFVELKVDLNRLKNNKDFHDYVKTKKYKHNYPNTYYYPRVKYFVNPHTHIARPNNSRLIPYLKGSQKLNKTVHVKTTPALLNSTANITKVSTDWKPIVVLNTTDETSKSVENKSVIFPKKQYPKPFKTNIAKRKRIKRELSLVRSFESDTYANATIHTKNNYIYDTSSKSRGFFDWIESFFSKETIDKYAVNLLKQVNSYTKSVIKENFKEDEPPVYYTAAYDLLIMSLDIIEGLVNVQSAIEDHVTETKVIRKVSKKKKKHVNKLKGTIKEPMTNATELISKKKNKIRKL